MKNGRTEEIEILRKELNSKLEELKKIVSDRINEMKPRSPVSNETRGWSLFRMLGFGRRRNE